MKMPLRFLLSIAVLSPIAASAADYDPPLIVEEAAEFVPVEVGSGWYLRGDVGYIFSSSVGGVDYTIYEPAVPPDPAAFLPASFTSAELDPDFSWGGGFGYRFTEFLRADATVEGYRSSFSGSTASDDPCAGMPDDTSCRSSNSSEVSAIGLMANGYVDLGTYVGFTPYVGAGVGYSLVRWQNLENTSYCVDGAVDCPTLLPVGSSTHPGEDGWRLTYALMAGFAYDINKNLKLDVGYKYRSIDGGDMFGWDSADTFGDGKVGSLDTHEVKLGLRYELW
ncbi:outer membrane protein [Mesorhizobium sp. VNQ89]|uniref:outer membrane protein n=1 Tax=Mesorhizobium quangtriensis TaxID=3157709 RepID=UPI0032B79C5C